MVFSFVVGDSADRVERLWDEDVKVQQVGYLTDLLGSHAVNVINCYANAGRPFFLSLHFNAPHWPWEEPRAEAESQWLIGHRLVDFDGGSQATYQRMIEDLDLQVGRVLGALHGDGILDNISVIFTSDNGGERFADTWPFTGRKTELLEGGLRIPAIISWPVRIATGQTTNQVVISMDWLPTLLAAAGTGPDAVPTRRHESAAISSRRRHTGPPQALLVLQSQCPACGAR